MRLKTIPIALCLLLLNLIETVAQNDSSSAQFSVEDSTITEFVEFFGREFENRVRFRDCTFNEEVLFDDADFLAGLVFTRTKFVKEISFTNAHIGKNESYPSSTIEDVDFEGSANLDHLTVDGRLQIRYSRFHSSTNFSGSKFKEDVDFQNTHFKREAKFANCYFDGDVDFAFARFDSIANFSEAEFHGDVDFSRVNLPRFLDFSYAVKISEELDLTNAQMENSQDTCYIHLTGSAIDKFKFRYKRFALWFPEDTLDFELKSNVYEELLEKQKESGYTQSYEKLDREYREFKYTGKKSTGLEKLWGYTQNWVDKNWWGYGYSKELIVLNTIVLFLFFSLLNSFIFRHLVLNVYESPKVGEFLNEVQGGNTAVFIKSIPFVLFYTAQIFFGFKFELERLRYKENLQGWKIVNILYFFIIYLSGLVCLAYLMNYIITI